MLAVVLLSLSDSCSMSHSSPLLSFYLSFLLSFLAFIITSLCFLSCSLLFSSIFSSFRFPSSPSFVNLSSFCEGLQVLSHFLPSSPKTSCFTFFLPRFHSFLSFIMSLTVSTLSSQFQRFKNFMTFSLLFPFPHQSFLILFCFLISIYPSLFPVGGLLSFTSPSFLPSSFLILNLIPNLAFFLLISPPLFISFLPSFLSLLLFHLQLRLVFSLPPSPVIFSK